MPLLFMLGHPLLAMGNHVPQLYLFTIKSTDGGWGDGEPIFFPSFVIYVLGLTNTSLSITNPYFIKYIFIIL